MWPLFSLWSFSIKVITHSHNIWKTIPFSLHVAVLPQICWINKHEEMLCPYGFGWRHFCLCRLGCTTLGWTQDACFCFGLCRSLQAGGTAGGRLHGPRVFTRVSSCSHDQLLVAPSAVFLGYQFVLVQGNCGKRVGKLEKKMVQKRREIRSSGTFHAPTEIHFRPFHRLIRPSFLGQLWHQY